MTSSLNLKTGIFNSPKKDTYIVTLTALLAPIDDNRLQSYSQMFILKNGELTSKNHYLLVKAREIADLREEITLDKGDTLEVLVGHHVNNVNNFVIFQGFGKTMFSHFCLPNLNGLSRKNQLGLDR